MASDADWVEDVRRWYFSGQRSSGSPNDVPLSNADDGADALGYEAADPALQARHWPDAPSPQGHLTD